MSLSCLYTRVRDLWKITATAPTVIDGILAMSWHGIGGLTGAHSLIVCGVHFCVCIHRLQVFFSARFFKDNVMVEVALRKAHNPVRVNGILSLTSSSTPPDYCYYDY